MCGFMVYDKDEAKLRKIGVKDSKLLSPKTRTRLAQELIKTCLDYIVLKTEASEIDSVRDVSNLNRLEIEKMAQIINTIKPDIVYIDAIESNVNAFKKKISTLVEHNTKIVAENYADKTYPVVSAASIIAKVQRDSEIEKLHEKYGFFGSGYTSDPETVKFLKTWIENNKEFPPCVRNSWITAVSLKSDKEQRKIDEWR